MEANNRQRNRQRIKGKDFVEGGVYEVYYKDDDHLRGIYFYPTSYPERMNFVLNSRGIISKTLNTISGPLKLLILNSNIYYREKDEDGKYKKLYMKFDKSTIYGKKPFSIIRSNSYYSEEIDLSDLDLSYAKLRDSHLVRFDLSNTILSHANLTGSDLTGANLSRANLTGAKLGKTILKDIESSQIIGSPDTLPKGYYLVKGCIIGPDTKISNSLGNKYRQIKNINDTNQYLVGPNVDLTGVDLSKIERFALNNSDLTGANLSRANLTGVYLSNVNLTGANLTGAILTGAELINANLNGADLTDAILTGAHILTDTNLTDANLTDTELTNSFFYDSVILTGIKTGGIKGIPKKLPKRYYLSDGIIIGPNIDIPNNNTFNTIILKKKYKKIKIKNNKTKEYLIGPNVDLTGANLTGANLTGAILTGAILISAILTDADLTGLDLTDTDLTDANLSDVNLTGADLTGAKLTGIKSGGIKGNPRLPSRYVLRNGYIIGPNVNLTHVDLTGLDLTDTDLTDAKLSDVNLTGANLTGAILTSANILTGTNLTDANLTDAELTKSLFYDSVILTGIKTGGIKGIPIKLPKVYFLVDGYIIGPNVDLTGANLTNANLNDSILTGIKSGGIQGIPRKLPYDYVLINGYIIGPKVNLTNADLTDANLTDVNLDHSDLTGIKSGGIQGIPRKLPYDYVLINGYIIGPKVNLIGADLSNANLTGMNLTDVDLTGSDLTGIKSGKIEGKPKSLPKNYVVINSYIIGPNINLTDANLTDADLTGVDLTDVDLTGVNLTRANLNNAILTGIISGGIKGEPKLPKRYVLIDGFIIGPNVNLSNKILIDIDLSYVNLSGANLSGIEIYGYLSFANLKKADLTDADLTSADLTRANLKGANLTGTKLFADSLSEKQKQQIVGEPEYIQKYNIQNNKIHISKRITDGKKKINKEQMDRAKRTVQNKNNEHAIREAYNKRMENKRKQNKEDKKESMKESIKKNILEKEEREPTQNEINRIYKNTKQRIKDSKKESIRKSFLEKEEREPTQKEINSIYKNTKKQKENKNFSDLLDYLLDKKNQVQIARKFVIVGETGINAGGLTRSIFEKCYKIFIERYFKKYIFNDNNYVILKNLNLNEELFEEFKKACDFLILLARRCDVKILIQINPQLLELLQLGELKYYKKYVLLNNSNNSFSLKRIQNGINNNSNNLNSFSLKRIQNGINNNSNNSFNLKRIQRQKRSDINENKIIESDFFKQLLENNGIFDHKHFNKVKEFYILFWKPNPDIFTNHIDYSWDNFKERLRFQLPNSPYSFNSFDEFMTEENIQINTYPFIEFIIKYLKYSDEYRMRFTTLTCGSYTYIGSIYINIFNKRSILDPFNAHTCFQTIDVNIKLSDRYPVIYHALFCERRNQVVNNPNESGRVNGRGRGQNESGNGNGNGNGRGSVRNESGNGNGNGNGRGSGRENNERGIVNNKSCRYSIEKLNKLIIDSINQGFNIA